MFIVRSTLNVESIIKRPLLGLRNMRLYTLVTRVVHSRLKTVIVLVGLYPAHIVRIMAKVYAYLELEEYKVGG